MRHFFLFHLCMLIAAMPVAAPADILFAGGDLYVAGSGDEDIPAAGRDIIGTGFSLRITAPVAEDAFLSGASISVEQPVGGDLSAFGGRVLVEAGVGGDLSVSGFAVETGEEAAVDGNARLSGGSVKLRGPVTGALVAAGGEVTLDAPVEGDVHLSAGKLVFGEAARIGGRLHYSAREEIEVPASVVPADRVTFTPFRDQGGRMVSRDWDEDWPGPGRGAMIGGALTVYLFFVVAGGLLLAFLPRTVTDLADRIAAGPAVTLMSGLAGLGAAFGLVPILALSIIGLPLIPVILLAIVLLWMAGYLLGIFTISMRVLLAVTGTGVDPSMWAKLGALAAGLGVAMLLNFIPVLGWVLNFAALLLGVGAIMALPFDRRNRPVADA